MENVTIHQEPLESLPIQEVVTARLHSKLKTHERLERRVDTEGVLDTLLTIISRVKDQWGGEEHALVPVWQGAQGMHAMIQWLDPDFAQHSHPLWVTRSPQGGHQLRRIPDSRDLAGRKVFIVDDMAETKQTLVRVRELLEERAQQKNVQSPEIIGAICLVEQIRETHVELSFPVFSGWCVRKDQIVVGGGDRQHRGMDTVDKRFGNMAGIWTLAMQT